MTVGAMLSEEVFDKITMGVVHYIKQKPGVQEVTFPDHQCTTLDVIESWEDDSNCKLPDDLKNFYLTINGLLIEWNVELNEEKHSVGCIKINPIESLNPVGKDSSTRGSENTITLKDIDIEPLSPPSPNDTNTCRKPKFTDKLFQLSCEEIHGTVCLVYKDSTPSTKTCDCEIWFLDYSLQWHFLAPSFILYYRMLISHIGIPGWQYLFTDVELSAECLLWCSMYLSYRLPSSHTGLEQYTAPRDGERNRIDFATLFKSKVGDKRRTEGSKQGKGNMVGKQRSGAKTGVARSLQKTCR